MKNYFTSALLCLFPILAIISCTGDSIVNTNDPVIGNGKTVSQYRTVNNFSGIEMIGNFQVNVKTGTSDSVKITADDNVIGLIRTEKSNNVLKIYPQKSISTKSDIVVDIWSENISDIRVDGNAAIVVEKVKHNSFFSYIEGNGSLVAAGDVSISAVQIVGNGSIDFYEMNSDTLTVNIEGNSTVKASVKKLLDVVITGLGTVSYKGEPEVRKNIVGLGSITKVQ